jgi:molybdopterin/thiamine biosynthesis adenylyltransferase
VEDVQRLNPRVRVLYDTAAVSSKQSAFFEQFDVIIATDIPFSTMVSFPFLPTAHIQLLVNEYSRSYNIPFYAASLHGLIGIVFVDIIKYSYLVTKQKPDSQPETILKTEIYEPLHQSISTAYGKSLKPRQARKVSHLLPLSLGTLLQSTLLTLEPCYLGWTFKKAFQP